MRTRLLRSTLSIALLAVVLLGVPLALLARHQVWVAARTGVSQQAAGVAAGLDGRLDAGQQTDLTGFARVATSRRIVLVTPLGVTTAAGAALHGRVVTSTAGVDGYVVTVQESRLAVEVGAWEATALVAALSLLAVGAAVALALRQADQLSAPLALLLTHADALGVGDFGGRAPVSGIPEVDGISRALAASARKMGQTLELQRDFAGDAAHQLRTPLTGIGLRLDELVRIGDQNVRQEADHALRQVERLDRVISALLARARGDAASPELFDVDQLLQAEASAWSETLLRGGRSLEVTLAPSLTVLARAEHVTGALTCLMENAVRHGSGRVCLVASGNASEISVRIWDEGSGVPPLLADRIFDRRISGGSGSGIGLALARSLVTAEGGTLRLTGASEFRLTLPSHRPA